jgi:hypothetical protein
MRASELRSLDVGLRVPGAAGGSTPDVWMQEADALRAEIPHVADRPLFV